MLYFLIGVLVTLAIEVGIMWCISSLPTKKECNTCFFYHHNMHSCIRKSRSVYVSDDSGSCNNYKSIEGRVNESAGN